MSTLPKTDTHRALLNYALQHLTIQTHLCTWQQHQTGYSLKRRTLADYNFIYVLRGRLVWVIGSAHWPLRPGSLLIVPPKIEHSAYSLTARVQFISVHVEATLPGARDVFDWLVPPRLQQVPEAARLNEYFKGAAREFSGSETTARTSMLQCWGTLITTEFLREAGAAGRLKYRSLDPVISVLLQELEQHVCRPVSLAQLAKRAGYSPQYLNRIFQRTLGTTPLQYLARLRMQKAAALLREDTLTVRAVGERVGYEDAYYFSRVFRQHFGLSPAQYQQAAVSDSPAPDSAPPFTSTQAAG